MIYLDNASTTIEKPQAVVEAVTEALTGYGNPSRSGHNASLAANRLVYRCREQIAKLVRVPGGAEQVAFTSGATEALNAVLFGLFSGEETPHIVTTVLEHNSVLRPLYRLKESGVELSIVSAGQDGRITPEDIAAAIRPETAAIVCTHASNLCGNTLDLAAVGELAQRQGCRFVVDATQTIGFFPIDMESMHIDALCFSAHKGLCGPQGIGAVALRSGLAIRPWKLGGSGIRSFSVHHPAAMPAVLEAGTLNTPGIAGLSAALDVLAELDAPTVLRHEQLLSQMLYEGASKLPDAVFYGDFSDFSSRAAVLAMNFRGVDSARLADILAQDYGILTRPGIHCAPLAHRTFGTEHQGAVRFSLSRYTTEADISAALSALRALAS